MKGGEIPYLSFPPSFSPQGTDYENHVDVGRCSSEGVCEGKSCEAVSLDFKTIPTPDGQSSHNIATCMYI